MFKVTTFAEHSYVERVNLDIENCTSVDKVPFAVHLSILVTKTYFRQLPCSEKKSKLYLLLI